MDRKAIEARLTAIETQLQAIDTAAATNPDNLPTVEQADQITELATEQTRLVGLLAAAESRAAATKALATVAAPATLADEGAMAPAAPGADAGGFDIDPFADHPARAMLNITLGRPNLNVQETHGFESFGAFVTAVYRREMNNHLDPRLLGPEGIAGAAGAAGGMQAASTAPSTFGRGDQMEPGGALVPPAYAREVWRNTFKDFDLLSMFGPLPTESNVINIPKDQTTPWGSSGVQAYWGAEGAATTESKPSVGTTSMSLNGLNALVPLTDELLEDAPRAEQLITQAAADAIRWVASDALVNGNGVGRPLGILNAAALVSQAKEGSQTADTINANNIAKMLGRVQGGGPGSFWLIHPDAFNQLVTMTLGNQPIWSPPVMGMQQSPSGSLLGLPVVKHDSCQTLGDKGDIYLVDPYGYALYIKTGGIRGANSIHLWFDRNTTAFRWNLRIGGHPYLSAAVSPPNGSSTRSHFVTLAERT